MIYFNFNSVISFFTFLLCLYVILFIREKQRKKVHNKLNLNQIGEKQKPPVHLLRAGMVKTRTVRVRRQLSGWVIGVIGSEEEDHHSGGRLRPC